MKRALLIACTLLALAVGISAQSTDICEEDQAAVDERRRIRKEASRAHQVKTDPRNWIYASAEFRDGERGRFISKWLVGYAHKMGVKLPHNLKTLPLDEQLAYQRQVADVIKQARQAAKLTTVEALSGTIALMDTEIEELELRKINKKCQSDLKPAATNTCSFVGRWTHNTPGIGSTYWDATADGKAKETGIGNASGNAKMFGRTLRIDWSHPNGWSGYYEWMLDEKCSTGTGFLQFKSGRTDQVNGSTVKKS